MVSNMTHWKYFPMGHEITLHPWLTAVNGMHDQISSGKSYIGMAPKNGCPLNLFNVSELSTKLCVKVGRGSE